MQEVYASLLLHDAKQPITEENVKKILQSVGSTVDEAKIKALVASLEGQNIDELIKQAAVAVSAAPAAVAGEKKEEKSEEEEKKASEEASAGLSALFG